MYPADKQYTMTMNNLSNAHIYIREYGPRVLKKKEYGPK